MRDYELMLILDPTISEEDRNTSIDSLKKLIETNSSKITKEDIWWDKKLAYKINKSDRGFYLLFELQFENASNIKEISKNINLDRNIRRYMFVRKS